MDFYSGSNNPRLNNTHPGITGRNALSKSTTPVGADFRIAKTGGGYFYLDLVEVMTLVIVMSDFDKDYDVDSNDFARLQDCATGPMIPQNDPDCRCSDLDADGDVDQSDFGIFQRCFSGPDVPPDPNCKY